MSTITAIKSKDDLKISSFKRAMVHKVYVHLSDNSLGIPWKVPVVLIRGKQKGPVLGVTAALHGDELNGISTILNILTKGGIVDVFPKLTDRFSEGELIAKVYDVFGTVREEIYSDQAGIVIGRNSNPQCEAGSRILHLGVDIFEPHPHTIPAHE